MRAFIILQLAAAAAAAAPQHGSGWDPKYTAMAQATLAKMTSAQKFTMIHGAGGGYGAPKPLVGGDGAGAGSYGGNIPSYGGSNVGGGYIPSYGAPPRMPPNNQPPGNVGGGGFPSYNRGKF
jgi:hypothetical protein